MGGKLNLGIDKPIYVEGEQVKLKLDYESQNPKQILHLVVYDPAEREAFSADQYQSSQKGGWSMVFRFDTKKWSTAGRYKVASWDQEGSRKEVFFQLKAKGT